jgi:hypothetical protein
MADNAAMLAAQAEAGQAGVTAYQQAQAELERRRQQAIQQAIMEAQMRGAAPASAQAAAVGVGDASGERLQSLAQEQATYTADLARRGQRMNDYSNAVQSARGLIGEQVGLAVAPINAQSAADVAKIDAQTKAQLALAAYAKRAGGGGGGRGGGGGGGRKLSYSQTEAQAAMVNAAAQRIAEKEGAAHTAANKQVDAYRAVPQPPRVEGANTANVSFREESPQYRAQMPAGAMTLSDLVAATSGTGLSPSDLANAGYRGIGAPMDWSTPSSAYGPGQAAQFDNMGAAYAAKGAAELQRQTQQGRPSIPALNKMIAGQQSAAQVAASRANQQAEQRLNAIQTAMRRVAPVAAGLATDYRTTRPLREAASATAEKGLYAYGNQVNMRNDPQYLSDTMLVEGQKLGIPADVLQAALYSGFKPGMSLNDYLDVQSGTPTKTEADKAAKDEVELADARLAATPVPTFGPSATVGDVAKQAGVLPDAVLKVTSSEEWQTAQQAMDESFGRLGDLAAVRAEWKKDDQLRAFANDANVWALLKVWAGG